MLDQHAGAVPQSGIFALGEAAHNYLELHAGEASPRRNWSATWSLHRGERFVMPRRPGGARQICAMPPSTATSLAVMKLLSDDARKAATAPIEPRVRGIVRHTNYDYAPSPAGDCDRRAVSCFRRFELRKWGRVDCRRRHFSHLR